MLYSEIIAVCSEIHKKHINTLCRQNVDFANVNHGSAYMGFKRLIDFFFARCKNVTIRFSMSVRLYIRQ
jgi:hypothetical protein